MMNRLRLIHFMGPVALALGVVVCVGTLRGGFTSTAFAGPPYSQTAASLPGGEDPSLGPLFNRSGNNERNAQIALLQEIAGELRAIRGLLESGNARVRVDAVELDYDRLADAVSVAMPSQRASGASNASIRRTSGSNGSEDSK